MPYQFWVIGQLRGEAVYRPPAFTRLDVIATATSSRASSAEGAATSCRTCRSCNSSRRSTARNRATRSSTTRAGSTTRPRRSRCPTAAEVRVAAAARATRCRRRSRPSPGPASERHDPPGAVVDAADTCVARRKQLLESIGTRYHVPWKDGSNSWVVSPKKTTNGHAFLWGGPQEGFDSPNIDWEMYQHGPGFDSGGMTIALAPVVLIGRNANIAFTTTSEETVDQPGLPGAGGLLDSPPTYRFNGADVPMTRCRTRCTSPASRDQTFVSYRTVHGPVFDTDPAARRRVHDEVRVVRPGVQVVRGLRGAVDRAQPRRVPRRDVAHRDAAQLLLRRPPRATSRTSVPGSSRS